MSVAKKKLIDGTVIIECPVCQRWRHHRDFLIGSDTKDPVNWVPECYTCRVKSSTLQGVGMPEGVNASDKAKDCGCGDGVFRYSHTGLTGGRCYRCKGKAWQDWSDVLRNQRHDEAVQRRISPCDPEFQDQKNIDEKEVPMTEEVKQQEVHIEDIMAEVAGEYGI